MDFEQIFQEVLTFAGTFNLWLILSVFVILFFTEFGLSIPYLLETIWMLCGYNVLSGTLSPFHLLLLWLIAIAGRFAGATILFHLAKWNRGWIMKIYSRVFGEALSPKKLEKSSLPARVIRSINLFSPFSVAFGRLIWLKIPMTLTLGVRRQLMTLYIAIVVSGAIWDISYMIVGVIGRGIQLRPSYMILYSLGTLTIVYSLYFIIRKFLQWRVPRHIGNSP
jgi:membrane-associated protein